MTHETKIPDGRLGAGYTYQWRVALYLLVKLRAASRSGLSSDRSIGDFVRDYVELPDADLLLEGHPEPREDIEIEGRGKDGRTCRVRFQVKTKREDHLVSIDRDPIASIVYKALSDTVQDSPLVIVSNTGISDTGHLAQTLPMSLRSLQKAANKRKSKRLNVSDLAPLHVYFWQLPQATFLDEYLLAAFDWKEGNVAVALDKIARESTTSGGTRRKLRDALAELDPYMPARKDNSGWREQVTHAFEAQYAKSNSFPSSLATFFDSCYVTRDVDAELAERAKALNIASISDQLDVIQKARQPTLPDEQADATLQTLNAFVQDLRHHCVVREIYARLERLTNSLAGSHQLAKGPYFSLVSTARTFERELAGYRRSILLIGAGGDGKTLAALRLCRSAKWYCVIRGSSLQGPTAHDVIEQLKQYSGATSDRSILDQMARLNEELGPGFVFIDGLDECRGCNEATILALLQSIEEWPGTFHVLVTVREDYLESRRVETRRDFNEWQAEVKKCAAIAYVPSISHETPTRWLQAYCRWYDISEKHIATAWATLSHRFRARDLRYVFSALVRLLREEPTLRFLQTDVTAIYAYALVSDCKERAPAKIDRSDVERELGFLASIFWRDRQRRPSVSYEHMDDAATGAAKEVFDTLVERCGELIVTQAWETVKAVEWRMPDASLFYVARSLFGDPRPKDAESIHDMLGTLTETFGRRASDVVIHFLRECEINRRSDRDPELRRTYGHATIVPPKIVDMMIEGVQSRGNAYIAFLIFRFEQGDLLALEAQPSETDYKEISPDTAADYLNAVARSLVERHEQEVASRIRRFIDVAMQINQDVADFSSVQLDFLVGEFVSGILASLAEPDEFHLSVVTLLEDIPEPFQEVTSKIVVWLKLVLGRHSDLKFFDEFLLLLGGCRVGRFSREVSKSAARRLVELELAETLLCGPARMYDARQFFVRRDIINAFAHSLSSRDRFFKIFDVLQSGELEHRRNGVFLAQQYFKRAPEDVWRAVFPRVQVEMSTEVVSTALAVCLEAQRNQGNSETEARYALIDAVSPTRSDEIMPMVEHELASIENAEKLLDYLLRIRGIVDVWSDVGEAVLRLADTFDGGPVEQSAVDEFVRVCEEEPELSAFIGMAKRLLKTIGRRAEASAMEAGRY